MKFNQLNLLLAFLFVMLITPLAKSQFSVEAQLRNRFEIRDGYQKLGSVESDPAFLISQRSRLSFSYQTPFLKLKFTPQDVRLWPAPVGRPELESEQHRLGCAGI
jgi:hypothetical protein